MITELSYEQNVMRQMCVDRVSFPLFVGGYGSGKSFILTRNASHDVMSFRGCRVAVYAPTYDLLELNLVPEFEHYFDLLGIKHKYNVSKHILHLPGDRKIIFRSLMDEKRIVAYSVYSSHVDEADLMPMDKAQIVWDRVIARNRQHHPEHGINTKILIAAYTTPESYRFTYNRWKKSPGEGYKYVRAPTWSNNTLQVSYIRGLISSYTPQQQKAYLSGIWTNINSGSVYSYFDPDIHNTKRNARTGDVLYIGQDFNYGGCCGAVYTIDRPIIDGVIRPIISQVDEYADVTTFDVLETLQSRYPNNQCIIYPDVTGVKKGGVVSADIAILQEKYRVVADSINPTIEDRVNAVQRLFHNDMLYINPVTCPQSFAARIEHAYSKLTGKPDKHPGPGTIDDRNDAGDYPLANLFPIKSVIHQARVYQ